MFPGWWQVGKFQTRSAVLSPSCSLLVLPGATHMKSESVLEAYQAPRVAAGPLREQGPHRSSCPVSDGLV